MLDRPPKQPHCELLCTIWTHTRHFIYRLWGHSVQVSDFGRDGAGGSCLSVCVCVWNVWRIIILASSYSLQALQPVWRRYYWSSSNPMLYRRPLNTPGSFKHLDYRCLYWPDCTDNDLWVSMLYTCDCRSWIFPLYCICIRSCSLNLLKGKHS